MFDSNTKGRRSSIVTIALFAMMLSQVFIMAAGEGTFSDGSRQTQEDGFELVENAPPFTSKVVTINTKGEAVFAGTRDGIRRYNFTSGRFTEVQTVSSDYSREYRGMDTSPSGETLLVGSYLDMTLTVDANYFKHPKTVPGVDTLYGVSWKPDGSYALAVGNGGAIMKYLPEAPELTKLDDTTLAGYNSLGLDAKRLKSIDWHPSGDYALILSDNWNIYKVTDTNITDITGPLPATDWIKVTFSPDGSKAILVSISGLIYLYDHDTKDFVGLTMPDPGYSINSVAWKDSSTAYVAGFKGSMMGLFRYSGASTLTDISPTTDTGCPLADLAFTRPTGSMGLGVGACTHRYPNQPPTKPTVTMASKTLTSITITHSKSEDVDFGKYEYHISLTKGFTPTTGTYVGNSPSRDSYTKLFDGLTEKTLYYIIVRTCDLAGLCTASDELEASTLDVTNPTPVTLSAGTADYTAVPLSWTQFADIDFARYEIHMGTTSGFTIDGTTLLNTIDYMYTTSTTATGLLAGTTYYFKVRTYNTHSYHGDSNEVSATTLSVAPPQPVMVQYGGNNEDGYPIIQWTIATTDNFARYEVHYSETAGFIPSPGTKLSDITNKGWGSGYANQYYFTASPSDEGKTFYFIVRVIDTYGGKADSETISMVYNTPPPGVTGLEVKSFGIRDATIIWQKPWSQPADFDHYEIYKIEGTMGKPKKVGEVSKFNTTSYKVTGLNPSTQYMFIIYVVDKGEVKSGGSTTTRITTKEDQVANFFGEFNNEGCICGGGFFVIVFFIAIMSALGQKYKAKGVVWGIPILVGIIIVIAVTAINYLFELTLPTWYFSWLLLTCVIIGIITGVAVVLSGGSSYTRRNVLAGVGFMSPFLIGLIIIYAVTINNNAPGQKDISTAFFGPLIIATIIISVCIFGAFLGIKKYKDIKWREEYERRQAQERLEKFENRKASLKSSIEKLQIRLEEHKNVAPGAMFNDVNRSIKEAWKAWDQAITVDNDGHLNNAQTNIESAEKVMVDIEAFEIAKAQAKDQMINVKRRINDLKIKRAPKIGSALNLSEDAGRKLEEAQKLDDIKVVMDLLSKANIACEESSTSLKSAEDQLSDLKVQLSQIDARAKELCTHPKEMTTASKLSPIISGVSTIIISQRDEPNIEALSRGRELVRQAREIIQQIDDRDRQREVLRSDIESLENEKSDVATWSIMDFTKIEDRITKARAFLENDELGKARSAIDDGFGKLDEIRNNSIPKIVITDKEYEVQVNKWEELIIEMRNDGNAAAQDIEFDIESPSAVLQDVKDKAKASYKIKSDESIKVPVKIQFKDEGAVPITIFVNYRDATDRQYQEELPLKVMVSPKDMFKPQETQPIKKAVSEDFGLKIYKDRDYSMGFYKFKVTIENKGEIVARDVTLRLFYDKQVFKLHHTYPKERRREGDTVEYGDIDPNRAVPCEFYLEAHMCTKTTIDGLLTFKDIQGGIQNVKMKTHNEEFVCPKFADVEEITPAQVKEFLSDPAWKQEPKNFAVPSDLDPDFVFNTMKESIERFAPNLKHVFDDVSTDGCSLEAWYYGETEKVGVEGVKHVVIGTVQRVARAGSTLQLTTASMHQGQRFALSTRLAIAVSEGIQSAAKLTRPIQQIYQNIEIRDSVMTGSTIQMGGAAGVSTGGEGTGKVSIKDSVMVRSEVAGGKDVDVSGTVVQRSKLGGSVGGSYQDGTCQVPTPTVTPSTSGLDSSREMFYNIYRGTLRTVYEDGRVDLSERAMLKSLRAQLNISMEEHNILEEEIIQEREEKLAKDGKKD